MRNKLFIWALLLSTFPAAAQMPGLSVKPVRLFYTLLNGQSSVQTVYIFNNTAKDQQFKLYFEDWTRDSSGGHEYMPAGTMPRSCARWASINKTFIDLKPGESTDVLVKLDIPDSSSALDEMKWTMLFIETTAEKMAPSTAKGVTTMVSNISRIGVHVVQTPPTLTKKDVKMLSFYAMPAEENEYQIICQNTGQVQFDCNSYMELSSAATGEKTTIKANTFPLFPDQIRYLSFTLPDTLAKGKYTAVGVVDGGDDLPLQASEMQIEVK